MKSSGDLAPPVPVWALSLALTTALIGCRQESAGDNAESPGPGAVKPPDVLIFPESLRAADEAVNAFVTTAMQACAKGDYEAFRLLWSARESPLPRDEFEQGWNAARRIEVRGLQKGVLEADPEAGREKQEVVYALLAEVEFDPTLKLGKSQPRREVVLMLAFEQDRWRLAKAPRGMREWIKSNREVAHPTSDAENVSPPSKP